MHTIVLDEGRGIIVKNNGSGKTVKVFATFDGIIEVENGEENE